MQQGDALGPLLFSIALHPLLEQIRAETNLDIVVGYLDDIFLAGDEQDVLRAWQIIQNVAPGLGLDLNLSKCELVPTAADHSACDLTRFPPDLKRNLTGCFKLLGVPIGTADHVASYMQHKRVDSLKQMLDQTPLLEDAQVAHRLLGVCF